MLNKKEFNNLLVKKFNNFRNQNQERETFYKETLSETKDVIRLDFIKYEGTYEYDLEYYKNDYHLMSKILDNVKKEIKDDNFYHYYLWLIKLISFEEIVDERVNNNNNLKDFEYETTNIFNENISYKIEVFNDGINARITRFDKDNDDEPKQKYYGYFYHGGIQAFNRLIFRDTIL